jgi:hypothetical protein
MEPNESMPKPARPKGRPRRADAPRVDWAQVDAALVHGERHTDPDTGQEVVTYPSLEALAERHGVSRTLVWRYARRHRCYQRRWDAQCNMLPGVDDNAHGERPADPPPPPKAKPRLPTDPPTPPKAKPKPPTDPPTPPKAKRGTGRPRRGEEPKIPWPTVDAALVHGERHADPDTGQEVVRYPSLVELASRYGVTRTRMWKYAHKHNVYERRKEAQLRTQARTDAKLIEKNADSQAVASADAVKIVNLFLDRFEIELREGRVRTDSPSDFDRLARLRELLIGGADARTELTGGLTLEAIQARHRQLRVQVEGMSPELAGTASQTDDAGDADREEQAR